ncbi:MAG TPA: hypothetical protein PKD00_01345 [Burkholderiales bacterium]|nr:hypothetical protein [Burkholderiales bacterium]
MLTEMTFKKFVKKYKPVKNSLNPDASLCGYMFETFGDEKDKVYSTSCFNIWTLLDDFETIINGFHFANRLGYLITENSWKNNEEINVIVEDNEPTIKQDMLGKTPAIGDYIGFNPPWYKGLVYGTCIGFTRAGLPKINNISDSRNTMQHRLNKEGYYTPKTGFFIINKEIPVKEIKIETENILSADEFIKEYLKQSPDNVDLTVLMKNFAKYHLEKAIDKISDKNFRNMSDYFILKHIKNAYTVNNII